ncbi:Vacuolar import and degradation protein 27, partial [Coemansia nantahalensis]
MNALKSLGKLVWGTRESPEMFKLTSGALYELHPGAKVERRCVYKDAELGIRQTGAQHQYQLVAVRVLDEGEDLGDDLDDERAFLIGVELGFSAATYEGSSGFRWRELDGTAEYEYIADDAAVNKPTRDAFALAVAKCAWERKNRRSFTEAPDSELERILKQAEDAELERILGNVHIDDAELDRVVAENPEPPAQAAAAAAVVEAPVCGLPAAPAEMADGEITASVLGSLYLFDASGGEFVQVADEVALSVVKVAKFTYWINVASNARGFVSQVIEPEMNAVFNHDHQSLIWNYFAGGGVYSFSLVTADDKHYEAMHQGLTCAAYETLNQEPWAKASASSQDYLLDAYEEDAKMLSEPESWESDAEEDAAGVNPVADAKESSEGEDESEEDESESEEDEYESEDQEESEDQDDDEDESDDEIDQIFRKTPVPQGVKTGRDEAGDSSSAESESESESEESDA